MEHITGYRVDEPETQSFEAEKPPEPGQTEDFSEYTAEAQGLIDSYRRLFTTFASDVSLSFKLGQAFFIDLESGEVNLATKWFADKGFSKEQILWACMHELAHFRDLNADAKNMLGNFKYIRSKAAETGQLIMQRWEETLGDSDPEFLERLRRPMPTSQKDPSQTMNATERAGYKIHHTFYNIFDDIYVNNLVARRAPRFENDQAGGQAIRDLYRDQLFKESDYSSQPRHLQFLYSLLREEMVPDENVTLTDEVKEVLNRPILFGGKEYTARQIVEDFIKPRAGRDTKAGQRHFVLQKTLEPVFQELLRKDLEDWQPQKPEQQPGQGQDDGEGGAGDPFGEDYQEFDQNNPDQIDEDQIKDWVDKSEQEKQDKETQASQQAQDEQKSPEERAQQSQEVLDQSWCATHGISPEALRQFRRIEAEIEPYLQDLALLWRKIIFGSSTRQERELEGHFKTGTELDVSKAIEQWPQIERGELDQAEVMKRMVSKERLIQRPDLIRVRLVGDMSGSMDEAKRHILQQCFVLILSSLREFNTYLNLTRSQTKSKLEADTEAWIFGDSAQKIKRLRSETGVVDEQVETVKIFEQLNTTIGSTYDHLPLQEILVSLKPEDKTRMDQEKLLEILFEVTDGGSSDPASSRQSVDQLLNAGVLARAFQIGQVDDSERQTFNAVWNTNRAEAHGEVVGEKIDNLIPAITTVLKEYLGNVQL